MHFFAYPTAAKRYAAGRPFFHALMTQRIRAVCCSHGRVSRALDVGCGTGQSTLALLDAAEDIIGLDNSSEMLAHAMRHERIRFVAGQAEQMPFGDAEFELITVGLAFHWFDQRKFLLEAQRLLRPDGWLVIYNDVFTGRIKDNDNCEKWYRNEYLARYPSPPRNARPFPETDTSRYGLAPSGFEEFLHDVEFSTEELVAYLVTQTNVISAVESGKENLQAVSSWLLDSVLPLFSTARESFSFHCQIQFLKLG
jgi:ubiquinone/menaquinone biosynthesis C-methylase UbiE